MFCIALLVCVNNHYTKLMCSTLAQSKQTQTKALPYQTARDTAGVLKLVVIWYLKQPDFEPEGEEEVGVDDHDHDWRVLQDIIKQGQLDEVWLERQALLKDMAALRSSCITLWDTK